MDTTAAERIPGVRVVRDGTLVAVLHEQPDVARRALEQVKAEWGGAEPAVDSQSIYRHLVETEPRNSRVAASKGDLKAMEARSSQPWWRASTATPTWATPPWSRTPPWPGGKAGSMTVWASTQAPFQRPHQRGEALGLPARQVRIIAPFVGGGFGGKLVGPDAVEAARLARLVPGIPVQLAWGRKEDFFLDTFRPAAVVKIRAGLSQEGYVSFWDYQVYGINQLEAEVPATISRPAGTWPPAKPGAPPGCIRSRPEPGGPRGPTPTPSPGSRTWTSWQPRPASTRSPSACATPPTSAWSGCWRPWPAFGYEPALAPSGRGVGLACGAWRGTLVATLAQVAVDQGTGRIRVERVVEAVDMGLVVNPDGARQQVEGAVTMGLGCSLAEEVRFQGGRILDENFDTYQIPRFSWLPRIEVVRMDNPDMPAQGLGEPPVVTIGAALANAVFDAVGARVCQLAMTPERVLEALKQPAKV